MSLVWIDGFDHWGTTAVMAAKYIASDVAITTNPDFVRTGTGAIDIAGGDNAQRQLTYQLPNPATKRVGFGLAMRVRDYWGAPQLLRWGVHTNEGQWKAWITFNDAGQVLVYAGGIKVGESNPGAIQINAYTQIEAAFDIDHIDGAVEVRVNSVPVVKVIGVDTDAGEISGAGRVTLIKFGGASTTWPTVHIDDYFIWDGFGAANNDFMGDCRCRTSYPDADVITEWDIVGATSGHAALSNVPGLPNAQYIAADDIGDIATFGMSDIPTNSAAVFGVNLIVQVSKTDAGGCAIVPGIISDGSGADSPQINPGIGASVSAHVFERDPDIGQQWTYQAVNALIVRVERTA